MFSIPAFFRLKFQPQNTVRNTQNCIPNSLHINSLNKNSFSVTKPNFAVLQAQKSTYIKYFQIFILSRFRLGKFAFGFSAETVL